MEPVEESRTEIFKTWAISAGGALLCADLVGFGPPEQLHFSRIFMFAAKIADA